MEIQYFGHAAFKITGKDITIITDPFDAKTVGYSPIRQSADVVTVSHDHFDHNYLSAVSGNPLIFNSPGEYEVRGTEFRGVRVPHDDKGGNERGYVTAFVIEVDGMKICHLGDIGDELSSEQLEQIDDIDILLIPVGGVYTIDAEQAARIISEVEPRIVIPMHYGTKEGKIKLDGVDKFLHEMGVSPEVKERLRVSKMDLPEELEVIVLEY